MVSTKQSPLSVKHCQWLAFVGSSTHKFHQHNLFSSNLSKLSSSESFYHKLFDMNVLELLVKKIIAQSKKKKNRNEERIVAPYFFEINWESRTVSQFSRFACFESCWHSRGFTVKTNRFLLIF